MSMSNDIHRIILRLDEMCAHVDITRNASSFYSTKVWEVTLTVSRDGVTARARKENDSFSIALGEAYHALLGLVNEGDRRLIAPTVNDDTKALTHDS